MKKPISFLLAFIQLLFIGLVSTQDVKKEKLMSLADSNTGVIKLNSNSYERFTEGKRNYGLVVLLTALDSQFNCVPCREFDPEYTLVAKTFQKNKANKQLFFGHLDFKDGQAVYQKLKIMSAPNVFYFPPQEAGENKEYVKYDLARSGFTAESFAEFLSKESGHKVTVSRPVNYLHLATKVFLAVGAAAVLKLIYRHFGFIFYHKTTWTVISILIVLTMNSGYMWNRIRTPPFVMPGKNGEVNYIASGFSTQLGVEPQIVASIYGILSFSLLALIKSVPSFDDSTRQRFGVYIWTVCIIFVFSSLLAIFKIKNGGYPFKLLL
ncbi:uncharacterized protein EV154DRAFT_444953 [Mucor mucedo]|uniref:Uncharacterized protein n=1 Tax=Mucor saturninus TaxID=64648 RepID=A0A8H7UU95_9FUNG|nr:uncharacterized protein EV154DRAFT_444953 [Mucor mucedo]KAG2194302.1 hypothetical protein INT47_000445 [Mucor saturninus]KAI7890133.1 hypothetical protein EV154DRAFT_444953 [Mucor mucedo]